MFHCPQTNKSTRSAESSFAVDGDSTVIWLIEMRFNDVEEFSDDVIGWIRPINEEEIIMSDTSVLKISLIILGLVQPNYPGYANIFEDFRILVGMMTISMLVISLLDWTHEGAELAWDDPVEISVFYSLIVLIFFDVKCAEIVPSESHGVLETLQTMQKSTIIEAVALGGVPVVLEDAMIWSELLVGLIRRHLEDDDHEGAHQESSVDHFVTWVCGGAVMENAIFLVILISE